MGVLHCRITWSSFGATNLPLRLSESFALPSLPTVVWMYPAGIDTLVQVLADNPTRHTDNTPNELRLAMDENHTNPHPPKNIASIAATFEGSLAIIAVALGWAFGVMPTETLRWSLPAVGWGLVATVPMLVLLWICVNVPWRPLDNLTRKVEETIRPLLQGCSLVDLGAVSLLAGLGEEMLFRGFLQQLIADWVGGPTGIWAGLAMGAVVFGLLHAITPMYAVVACLIGLFLGWLWLATGNLLAPITAHAVYDFLALVYFLRIRPARIEV